MNNVAAIWPVIIALAAVVNGMGLVRLIGGFGEFVKKRKTIKVEPFWPFYLLVASQLMAHLLLWWSILGMRSLAQINFLIYLYLLIGPTLLYLCTSLMVPDIEDAKVDLKATFMEFRSMFFGISALFWAWALAFMPIFIGQMAPTAPIFAGFIICSLVLWWSDSITATKVFVVGYAALYIAFIALFGMEFGGVAASVNPS
ncbi:hypothetical protein [Umboniibacter marinipuniceus]|uniref:Uncharacterized protein n=1 Tax=Umboniibacter marinipuniceus TaxID=569599 RepID=A0A3M0AGH6_9GAMM|nr:hypothetical protein [Umboniibacter marinipuniceus]RMA82659.1 hypothetical protein DFR27_0611 [Umboniibacter marinipuniceus]